jgi:molecular chaperone GrpE
MAIRKRSREEGAEAREPVDRIPVNGPADEEDGADALGVVEEEITGLRDELEEVNRKWLRALADLDNYKKRIERDRRRWRESAREEILLDLLEVVDNFERAVACGDAPGPPPDDPFRQGVELILDHLKSILRKNGVEAIDTCGADFDPNLHEAIGHVESADHESNQIVEEERKGYTMGERLLRCARVVVAK